MYHLFRATRLGYKQDRDGIYFDSKRFTKEQAEAQFKPYNGITQRGFPYVGFEYDGIKYHDYQYLGEFSKKNMPHNDNDYLDYLLNKRRKTP